MATRSYNKVLLMGNLTRDPELRYTAGGTPVATFTVATNRTYVDSTNNKVESAEFTNVVAWAKLAEICSKLLKKGTKVFVEGRLQTSKWQDKNTGQEMRRTEVVAIEMQLISQPGGSTSNASTDEEADFDSFVSGDHSEDVDFGALTDKPSDSKDPSATPF
jgi:single-strand DNA-binding protein